MSPLWMEISELVHRYAALVDARDFDAVAELFTDDAELVTTRTSVATVNGRAAVRAELERVTATVATMHGVLAVTVDPDGPDRASGTVSAVAHHLLRKRDGSAVDQAWHLRYRDRYVRADRWRFARRELRVDWIETHPVAHWRDPHG